MTYSYRIVYKKPWIWPLLKWRFPKWDFEADTVTTIGNEIYTRRPLLERVWRHECVHIRQQRGSKLYAYLYFIPRYFLDKKFRARVEREAYAAEKTNS